MSEQSTRTPPATGDPPPQNLRWAWWGFVAVAGFFLLYEHLAHVIEWLPWVLLLACPLLHVFMRGGHGSHSDQDKGHRHE